MRRIKFDSVTLHGVTVIIMLLLCGGILVRMTNHYESRIIALESNLAACLASQ